MNQNELDQVLSRVADLYGFGGARMYRNLIDGGVPENLACAIVCAWITAQVQAPNPGETDEHE